MLNEFNFAKNDGESEASGIIGVDLCPVSMVEEIDAMNDFVYEKVLDQLAREPRRDKGREIFLLLVVKYCGVVAHYYIEGRT